VMLGIQWHAIQTTQRHRTAHDSMERIYCIDDLLIVDGNLRSVASKVFAVYGMAVVESQLVIMPCHAHAHAHAMQDTLAPLPLPLVGDGRGHGLYGILAPHTKTLGKFRLRLRLTWWSSNDGQYWKLLESGEKRNARGMVSDGFERWMWDMTESSEGRDPGRRQGFGSQLGWEMSVRGDRPDQDPWDSHVIRGLSRRIGTW
jgi:hypothetical protein